MNLNEYFDKHYIPAVAGVLRDSTVETYRSIYDRHLRGPAFGECDLRMYTRRQAIELLTSLARKKYNSNSIAHVRALMSGIYTQALDDELVTASPIYKLKVKAKGKPPEEGEAYSAEEINAILQVLQGDHKLIFALASWAALRPGEIGGLHVDDVDLQRGLISVERSTRKQELCDTKTEGSKAAIPLMPALASLLAEVLPAKQSQAWLFLNSRGRFLDMDEVNRQIGKKVRASGLVWKTLYAGRRACATLVTEATGDPFGAQSILRHTSAAITLAAYVKRNKAAAAQRGVQALQALATTA